MSYQEAINWLYTQLPVFQKVGGQAYHPGLDNILHLLDELDQPQKKFKSIHIAGTNGKGSVSHMLAAVFQQGGYKVGLYTSPHLKNFEERVKINGKEISKEVVVDFTLKMQQSSIKPSFFEMTVALAFHQFAKEKVDIAIVETGMGGRLDSTNVIDPVLSIITNISLDHQQYLGDTLEMIAFEKAGIIKKDIPVVIGEYLKETKPVFESKALQCKSPIYFAEDKQGNGYETDLKGSYQVKNLQTVSTALQVLSTLGYHFTKQVISEGLVQVQITTGLKGRYQELGTAPKIIADTGHNLAAIHYLIPQLLGEEFERLHIIIGMANDKDRCGILAMMPATATYYFCKPAVPRGLDETILKSEAAVFGLHGDVYASVQDAFTMAKRNAAKKDLIFVGGSTFVVAEVV